MKSSSSSNSTGSGKGSSPCRRHPAPPFDIETMEPLDVPPQWGWSDEIEAPPEDWWRGADQAGWQAPELPLDDGQVLVLDGADPFPADEWPVYRAD